LSIGELQVPVEGKAYRVAKLGKCRLLIVEKCKKKYILIENRIMVRKKEELGIDPTK
jgi:hypothetical protein